MAYAPHFLLAFGGTLFGTEQWTNTVRMTRPVEITQPSDAAIDDVIADVRAFVASSAFHNQVVCDWVKFNAINPDGHYADPSNTYGAYLTGTTGTRAIMRGTSTVLTAPQLAVKATFLTNRDRGPGSRGGFFQAGSPRVTAIEADGRMNAAAATQARDAIATFLNNLNNWPGWDMGSATPEVCIASQGGRGEPEPFNELVRAVTVGRVVDTQRRRREDLLEEYVAPAQVT